MARSNRSIRVLFRSAQGNGGAFSFTGPGVAGVTDSNSFNNSAKGSGGALSFRNTFAVLVGDQFNANLSGNTGGAVYATDTHLSTVSQDYNLFETTPVLSGHVTSGAHSLVGDPLFAVNPRRHAPAGSIPSTTQMAAGVSVIRLSE